MSKVNLAISGCMGRMGQQLIKSSRVDKNFKFGSLVKNEGLGAFWKGIQAGWLREASYTSVKLGMYGPIREALGASGSDAPFILKFATCC